ncbi:MAG: hydroxymethylglutaryl-CoA lyase [Rhizobiales bacterium]|nr:hydroxymethylglutaryl-CoA lyase [Hyphomicrobiales bacterium]OJY42906.1 MAG: hydroxymethylglutaryl-CoA lyase [Rhizobiales bacterium 64-17]
MTERILINEVGLRDGLQNQPSILSTDQKLALFHTLRAAGIRDFEATSFVSPKHVPQLADAAEFLRLLPQDRSLRYTCLIPNERGYERALAAGATGIAVVLSATEGLNQKNIGMSLVQATEVCERVVRRAKDEGLFARAYIAAAFACPFEGLTPPRVLFELLDRMRTAGADELAIADTIGAANPRQVKDVFQEAINRYDDSHVAAHFHDTRGLGTALAWTAAEAGVRRFDSSIAGLGGCPFAPGASGNVATEDLVFMFNDVGFETGIDFNALLAAVGTAATMLQAARGGHIVPWARSRPQAAE